MQTQVIEIPKKPVWLPPDLADSGEISVSFRLSWAEKKRMRKRKKIANSDWAEKHRYVTTGDEAGGLYQKKKFAYSPAVMDAAQHQSVHEIVLCWADQTGKSFTIDTDIASGIDQDPGDVLYVYPDEDTAKDNMKDRLNKIIEASPRLRGYTTGNPDDMGQKRINLQHMTIYAGWASSASKLANRPYKKGVADEVGKFPLTVGKKEAGPIDKMRKRFRRYRYSYRLWISSTPTDINDIIWQELNTCDIVFEYKVKCASCRHVHLMEFETEYKWFRWDDEKDPDKVQKNDLGYYICPGCGVVWKDYERDLAVRGGAWFAMVKSPDGEKEYIGAGLPLKEYLKKYNPRKIGFHLPSWISPDVGISEVCAGFMRGQKDKIKLKDWNNSHAAKPWTDFTQDRPESSILALCDDRPRGSVPGGGRVNRLIATLDSQGTDEKNEWYRYEVRAWGWGDTLSLPESWQVREGRMENFKQIEEMLIHNSFYDADGNAYKIKFILQDAMGRRTHDVINFCTRYRGLVWPTQGRDTKRMSSAYTVKPWEYYPGTKRPIPGGLKLIGFDNFYYKNVLAAKLEIAPDDPGAWHMHHDTELSWAQEMCAETIDSEKMRWVQIASRPNHAWDCSVLQCLAADMLWLKDKVKPENGEHKKGRRVRSRGI